MKLWHAMARGFTLIEMSIVLVVIGLLVSGGLLAVAPIIENSKVSETNQKLNQIEDALTVHAIRYGCLPCPATPTSDSSAVADAGRSMAGGAYGPGCTATACDLALGVVPWRNLDMSEAAITDGFGARISYAIGTGMAATDSMARSGTDYTPVGDLAVDNIAGTDITTVAAYVAISHGPNRIYGHLTQIGTQIAVDPNNSAPELANSVGGAPPYIQDDYRPLPGNTYFDDLVRWRSKPIITQLCGSGACGNP